MTPARTSLSADAMLVQRAASNPIVGLIDVMPKYDVVHLSSAAPRLLNALWASRSFAEGLALFAPGAALPEVLGEAGENRCRRSTGQLQLHADREELEALRAGDLLGRHVEDVSQQALDHARVLGAFPLCE